MRYSILLSVFLVLSGCASLQLNGDDSDTYSSRIGEATERDIEELVPRILREHDYDIRREEHRGQGKYIETYWRDRRLFDDERVIEGVEDVRTRILIYTREDSQAFNTRLFKVTFEVENQFKITDNGDGNWQSGRITDMAEDYLYEIERDLRVRVTEGARRY